MSHDLDADTWMEQALRDLRAAEYLLRGEYPAHASVFAHLAVEKALKGVFRRETGKNPPVSHDLRHLARRVGVEWGRGEWDAIDGLSDVSILSLYAPDNPFGYPVSEQQTAARERVADARTLVNHLRGRRDASDED